jgi:hypothetical protein
VAARFIRIGMSLTSDSRFVSVAVEWAYLIAVDVSSCCVPAADTA